MRLHFLMSLYYRRYSKFKIKWKMAKRSKSIVSNQNSKGNKIDLPKDATKKVEQTELTKIFAISETRKMIEPLRKALISRGWSEISIEDKSQVPSFIWLGRSDKHMIDGPIINRLKQNPSWNFCFKDILVDLARETARKPTKKTAKIANENQILNVPRTYKLFENERNDFIVDYRITACSSLVRFVKKNASKVFSAAGTVNPYWIDHAVSNLEIAIKYAEKSKIRAHSAVKKHLESVSREFNIFKKSYESIVKYESKVKATKAVSAKYIEKCETIWRKCVNAWPHFENDGFFNVWLLKPSRSSLGKGIKLFYDEINLFRYAKDNETKNYLIQKYVEQPLLIYKTKFDLRQYFLVTHHESSVRIWMYKKCYLKFSTKLYDPRSDKVCVHITNTAIQSKYKVDSNRSTNIPQCNEWGSDRFFRYLKNHKKLELWDTKIYPAMKQNIITTVSASLDLTLLQPNRFQLYGCDFMIDSNYEPILLEINGCPILTSVICSNCLEDVVKVVVDTKDIPSADTGHFEVIWDKSLL